MEHKNGRVRTTIAIDNDVMIAARQRADALGESLGAAISAMARAGMAAATDNEPHDDNGTWVLPRRGNLEPITTERVNELLNELEG